MVKTCTQCGRPNNNLMRVCIDCGADLPQAQDKPAPRAKPAPQVKPPRLPRSLQLKGIFGGRRGTMFEWVSVLALSVAIASALASGGALICLQETEGFRRGRSDISGGTAFDLILTPLALTLLAIYVTAISMILAFAAETVRRKESEARGLWLYLIVSLWLPALMSLLSFVVKLF